MFTRSAASSTFAIFSLFCSFYPVKISVKDKIALLGVANSDAA
jgi:hypothetical protein